MRKWLILLFLLILGMPVQAEIIDIDIEPNVTMADFWEKNGKPVQKINEVGTRILIENGINKRVVFVLDRTPNVINAYAVFSDKSIHVSSGLLPYVDNDDELAAILSHEIVHCLDFHEGFWKMVGMKANSKSYEYQADLLGIDLMVKAGFNPVAMISVENKIGGESIWDFGVLMSHPKTSRRLMEQYTYIYKKYPWALNSQMAKDLNYKTWTYTAEKGIKNVQYKEKERSINRKSEL